MIIHKRNKAFSFKEMSVDMHHGLAMWADWSFNFCIERDCDVHFPLLLDRLLLSAPTGGVNFKKNFDHKQNGK